MVNFMNSNTSKYSYLLKNIGLLSISKLGTKLLTFFLIPLYTAVLTTEEYGSFDFVNTTVSLFIPIFTLKITESVIRFSLEKSYDTKKIFSIGMEVILKGFVVVSTIIVFNRILEIIPLLAAFSLEFLLLYLFMALYQVFANFSRGIEDIKAMSIAGVLLTGTTICFNLLFLLVLKLGLKGYFYSIILGYATSCVFLIIKLRLWRYLTFSSSDKELKHSMIKYCTPLILNSISWWLNSAADRYTIIAICGVAANGLYSVASKIPAILDTFQNIFSDAWIISAVKEFNENENSVFFAQTYEIYNFMLVILCSMIIFSTKILAGFLFSNSFFEAWIFVPFLTIAILFGAVSGLLGGIFSSQMESKINAITTLVGAISNVVLNIALVLTFGTIGASVATMSGFFIVWLMRLVIIKRRMTFDVKLGHDFIAYIILIMQSVCLIFIKNNSIMYVIQICLMVILLLNYKDVEKKLATRIRRMQ